MEKEKVTNILIVDDEEDLRQSLAEILELEGLIVTQASDGYSAIEEAKKNSYDIALIDIKMPGINGIETLNQVMSIQPHIKAIMMTGHSPGTIQNSLLKTIYGFLQKPFYIEDLMNMIQEIAYAIA